MPHESEIENVEITVKKKSNLRNKILIINLIFDLFILIPVLWYFFLVPHSEIESLETSYVQVKTHKDDTTYKVVKKRPSGWMKLNQMNYIAIHAVVVSEDWAFYHHNGFDLGQIREAFEEAIAGDRTRGASTISQQVVKNVFLTSEKTLIRKLKELVYSITMERKVSKKKILEIYLNIAQFGDNLYGINNASRFYFNKSPKDLTPREGAFLAMLLPSPVRYSQSFRERELTRFGQKIVDSILEKMVKAKYLREDQLEQEQNRYFYWEKKINRSDDPNEEGTLTDEDGDSSDSYESKEGMEEEMKKEGKAENRNFDETQSDTKAVHDLKKKVKKIKDLDGSKLEASYGKDRSLEIEENPNFDEDAIMEDASGLQEEFNVE